eukprot:gene35527-18366_t
MGEIVLCPSFRVIIMVAGAATDARRRRAQQRQHRRLNSGGRRRLELGGHRQPPRFEHEYEKHRLRSEAPPGARRGDGGGHLCADSTTTR